jgi:hypothetical protein
LSRPPGFGGRILSVTSSVRVFAEAFYFILQSQFFGFQAVEHLFIRTGAVVLGFDLGFQIGMPFHQGFETRL